MSLFSLIRRFDLEAFLEEHGFELLIHRSGKPEWVGTCPECRKPKKLCVNIERRGWHCWVCEEYRMAWDPTSRLQKKRATRGAGGVVSLVAWLRQTSKSEAIEWITQRPLASFNVSRIEQADLIVEAADQALTPEIAPPEGWAPIYATLPYMLQRGITMDDARNYGLVWCPEGRYRDRLVFPVYEGPRLVYWQARTMTEAKPKTLNPPRAEGAAGSGDVLMNLDQAAQHPRVALVEGCIDVIKTGASAVCSFGKRISNTQIAKLVAAGVQAVDLMWDGPSATEPEGAHPEMVQVAPTMALYFDVRLVFLPEGDPGERTTEELLRARASGVPANLLSKTALL